MLAVIQPNGATLPVTQVTPEDEKEKEKETKGDCSVMKSSTLNDGKSTSFFYYTPLMRGKHTIALQYFAKEINEIMVNVTDEVGGSCKVTVLDSIAGYMCEV
tara:strand:- start:576 stop:881 length:306 start_codon:yes stop_codon:yes gene_type:complete